MPNDEREQLVSRIRGEYLEMPGLQLTPQQAQRLWSLDADTCASVLQVLTDRRFLVRGLDDRYRRLSDETMPGAPRAKTRLPTRSPRRYAG